MMIWLTIVVVTAASEGLTARRFRLEGCRCCCIRRGVGRRASRCRWRGLVGLGRFVRGVCVVLPGDDPPDLAFEDPHGGLDQVDDLGVGEREVAFDDEPGLPSVEVTSELASFGRCAD